LFNQKKEKKTERVEASVKNSGLRQTYCITMVIEPSTWSGGRKQANISFQTR